MFYEIFEGYEIYNRNKRLQVPKRVVFFLGGLFIFKICLLKKI